MVCGYNVEEITLNEKIELADLINICLKKELIFIIDLSNDILYYANEKKLLSDEYKLDILEKVDDEKAIVKINFLGKEFRCSSFKCQFDNYKLLICVYKTSLYNIIGSSNSYYKGEYWERGVWEYNISTGKLFFNNFIRSILNYGSDCDVALALKKVLTPKSFNDLVKEFYKSIKYHTGFFVEIELYYDDKIMNFQVYGKYTKNYNDEEIMIGEVIDITSRKHLIKRDVQNEKMKSLEFMAGGIAHDLNNRLMELIGSVDLLRKYIDDEKGYKYLNVIEKSISNTTKLINNLLNFSNEDNKKSDEFDLISMVFDIVDDINKKRKEKSNIYINSKAQKISVCGNKTLIQNAITNIVINAIEASNDISKFITINIEEIYLENIPENAFLTPKTSHGFYAMIEIIDKGIGIKQEHINKIFDPFFTTKGLANRTGLGLPNTLTAVKKHDGILTCSSKENKGTKIALYFPIKNENYEMEKRIRIMVIDDEEIIRLVVHDMLFEGGYQSICFSSGEKALEYYKENGDIDLAIVDMIMPNMSGKDLIINIHKLNPKMKFIILTAYSDLDIEKSLYGIDYNILYKPANYSILIKNVRKMLDVNFKNKSQLIKFIEDNKIDYKQLYINNNNLFQEQINILECYAYESGFKDVSMICKLIKERLQNNEEAFIEIEELTEVIKNIVD